MGSSDIVDEYRLLHDEFFQRLKRKNVEYTTYTDLISDST